MTGPFLSLLFPLHIRPSLALLFPLRGRFSQSPRRSIILSLVTLAALFSPFCSTFFPLRRATLLPLSHSLILLPLSISFSLVVRPHLVPLFFFPADSPFCLSREFQSLLFSSLLSLLHARLLLCLLRNRFFLARSFPSPFRFSLSIMISLLPLLSRLSPLPLFSSM